MLKEQQLSPHSTREQTKEAHGQPLLTSLLTSHWPRQVPLMWPGKYTPHQGHGCATASQDRVQPQGQYPSLSWPHSSQVAEPGSEPRQFILLTRPDPSYHVTLFKPCHLSGPLFVHPHTGCITAYVAGLCRVKGGGVHDSLKGSGGILGRSHSQPSFGNSSGVRLSSRHRQCHTDKKTKLPHSLENAGPLFT